jgi:hypothetical protein
MKILLMAPLWGQFGGKEQYIFSCIEEFTRMGHECSLVYGRTSSRPGQTCLPSIPTTTHVVLSNLPKFCEMKFQM